MAQAVGGAPNPDLAGLPTLGEVTATTGLMLSTQDFLTFLDNKGVQDALAPYRIGAPEVAEGKQLQAAWDKARGTLSVARGSETNSQRSNIGAREAFADWLGTWWGIARDFESREHWLLTAGKLLVGGEMALAGWSNGRSGRLRALCMGFFVVNRAEWLA